ncbi:peptidoglycan editing factor PgeF [Thiomicrospira sp. WB1]|uniref:peptidoglycan editing factor PgeF n=1 Tax=Thiomicrospira sp. WB1 TaxID=1685380 RepID=UPI00074A5DAA|nr:peptidoglycan editing factor PgeF [Thiomicrospira sp. WB1]KUJ72215.1 hypothetical protein AVO41_05740 [Thiomicrospira sp. WB1]
MTLTFMEPDWSLPAGVKACVTTRETGHSQGPWQAGNLADHVGDCPADVAANRQALLTALGGGVQPVWLAQTHSTHALAIDRPSVRLDEKVPQADASWTNQKGLACTVLTADCAPILLADQNATAVAAIHAGWRGLVNGVVANTIRGMPVPADQLLAWVGPTIGPAHFEVGAEVFQAFVEAFEGAAACFQPVQTAPDTHYMADLPGLVKIAMIQEGVQAITLSDLCTYSDPQRFYSYRREGQTGRQASLIWLT